MSELHSLQNQSELTSNIHPYQKILHRTVDWPWCGNKKTHRGHHLYETGPLHFKGEHKKMEASNKVQ